MGPKKLWPVTGLLVFALATAAPGWNATGHEQIAEIAWTRLNDRAKGEVREILLAGDEAFRPRGGSASSLRSAFRRAATFPDVIKGNQNTAYEPIIEEMNGKWDPIQDPHVSPNEKVRCKSWHYYDTPVRFTGAEPGLADSNALNALTFARTELARLQAEGAPDRKMQCWWLYWIEHLTGDLHQPLHCASSYEFFPGGDSGGNKFMILDPDQPGQETRLHAYWDAGIDHAKQADKAEGLPKRVDQVSARWGRDRSIAPAAGDARNLDVKSWLKEGAQLADRLVYSGIQRGETPSPEYARTQQDLCRRQAVLGGFRLANILNDILGR
jgi:hypothetical protein